jgi:hypothetical protein
MKSAGVSRYRGWLVAGFVVATVILGPATAAAEKQVRFTVSEPFRMGGRIYEAGVIAIRSVAAYTPSVALLKVWVNGECLGMISARRSVSEEPPLENEALFHRGADGRLEMRGFRTTGSPTGMTYKFPAAIAAAALTSAHTDFPSTISPDTARRAASANGSVSTVSTSSAWR